MINKKHNMTLYNNFNFKETLDYLKDEAFLWRRRYQSKETIKLLEELEKEGFIIVKSKHFNSHYDEDVFFQINSNNLLTLSKDNMVVNLGVDGENQYTYLDIWALAEDIKASNCDLGLEFEKIATYWIKGLDMRFINTLVNSSNKEKFILDTLLNLEFINLFRGLKRLVKSKIKKHPTNYVVTNNIIYNQDYYNFLYMNNLLKETSTNRKRFTFEIECNNKVFVLNNDVFYSDGIFFSEAIGFARDLFSRFTTKNIDELYLENYKNHDLFKADSEIY